MEHGAFQRVVVFLYHGSKGTPFDHWGVFTVKLGEASRVCLGDCAAEGEARHVEYQFFGSAAGKHPEFIVLFGVFQLFRNTDKALPDPLSGGIAHLQLGDFLYLGKDSSEISDVFVGAEWDTVKITVKVNDIIWRKERLGSVRCPDV